MENQANNVEAGRLTMLILDAIQDFDDGLINNAEMQSDIVALEDRIQALTVTPRKTATERKFLDALGISGAEQNEGLDLEYLKDVHWEQWLAIKNDDEL